MSAHPMELGQSSNEHPHPTNADREASPPGQAAGGTGQSIPEYIEPELCTLVDETPRGDQGGGEIKLDGYRMQARVSGVNTVLRLRKGLDWTHRFPEITNACNDIPDCIIRQGKSALSINRGCLAFRVSRCPQQITDSRSRNIRAHIGNPLGFTPIRLECGYFKPTPIVPDHNLPSPSPVVLPPRT